MPSDWTESELAAAWAPRPRPIEHQTIVKFTGSGHRAHCMSPGCRFIGQNHSMIRLIATGRDQATAWQVTKTAAESDARAHVNDARRDALRKGRR